MMMFATSTASSSSRFAKLAAAFVIVGALLLPGGALAAPGNHHHHGRSPAPAQLLEEKSDVVAGDLEPREAFHASAYDKAYAGTPAANFAGNAAIPAKAIAAAALKGKTVAATYPTGQGSTRSKIFSDWLKFKNSAAYVFTADMDVDCDGKDYRCPGNPDGQGQTDWGSLAAYASPWIVIPQSFVYKRTNSLPGHTLAAVICNGKLFYGVLGDTNGDSPEVTGEASWILARTCFPNENLSGSRGHSKNDVTYIVFTNQVVDKVGPHYINDFGLLRSMGDRLMGNLAKNLGLTNSTVPAKSGVKHSRGH